MADGSIARKDGLWAFFLVTFALMGLTFGVMAILQIPGPALDPQAQPRPIGYVLFSLGGFSPSIAAFVVAGAISGRGAVRDLWRRGLHFGLGARWYAMIVGIFVLAAGAQLVGELVAGMRLVRPWYFEQPLAIVSNLPAILILGPVSEEFGWRGFALDRMLDRWSRPVSNLVLGVFWALWHLPLFFVPGTSQSALGAPLPSFALFSVQVLALTVIYTWVYRRTGRSVWSAIFIHFMTTFAAFIAGGFIRDGGSFISLPTVGTLVVIALAITLVEDRAAPTAPTVPD